nr:class I SAM-dependent methyltransferase [Streptomyces sp. SID5643]
MYSVPDAHLHALGDVTGKRVLELGCGAGQWSRALASEGATVVGLDLSEAQLAAASRATGAARYPLVQGAAEQLPFAADSFDLEHATATTRPTHPTGHTAGRRNCSG